MKAKYKSYLELLKLRIVTLVLVTTASGYFLALQEIRVDLKLLLLLVGTAMTAGGSAALNNFLEREYDSHMQRTRKRALPSGAVPAANALVFGALLVLGGTVLLVWKVNLLAGFLSNLTAFMYVIVYTPFKRLTWTNTLVGAIPGALPPMGGWAAASGQVELGAFVLFAILFVWQMPHFYAIGWMYRDDYRLGGFKMLPSMDPDGKRTMRQILFFSILLLPISILPTLIGISGLVYLVGTLLMGLLMFRSAVVLARSHSDSDARGLLRVSLYYLPVILILIVADSVLLS